MNKTVKAVMIVKRKRNKIIAKRNIKIDLDQDNIKDRKRERNKKIEDMIKNRKKTNLENRRRNQRK